MKLRVIFFTIFMIFASFCTSFADEEEMQTEKARVLNVQEEQIEGEFAMETIQHLKLEILTGQYKGNIIESDNIIEGSVYDIPVEEGEKVLVVVFEEEGQVVAHVAEYVRDGYILYLCMGFAAVYKDNSDSFNNDICGVQGNAANDIERPQPYSCCGYGGGGGYCRYNTYNIGIHQKESCSCHRDVARSNNSRGAGIFCGKRRKAYGAFKRGGFYASLYTAGNSV